MQSQAPQNQVTLDKLIEYLIKRKGSDLHLSSGNYPTIRVDGDLLAVPGTNILDNVKIMEMLDPIISDKQRNIYKEELELDFSIKSKFGSRFRVNVFMNSNGVSSSFREIPSKVVTISGIGAPNILTEFCKLRQGLILVVGPTGSGKSTTLASMINHINDNFRNHIITIEDPIEFTYKSNLSLINQREVGSSTNSFPNALRAALREDPNVIMVGEMRDLETVRLALTAAETGHLVLATLHTNSAAKSINRIIDVFPSADKGLIRSMLASSLRAVISQRLIKRKDGTGRVPVYEVLIANSSIRNLIKEDKIPQINSMIEIGKNQGMIAAKDSILDLFSKDIITKETAEEFLISLE
ncbi:MAG: type pili twitching motility protein PilT [Rickettsiaceae bacterium]|jgi:twitching motility protein PilT|nr:type pili twitching motility protein PilT [Rickettsiaceae bacterium]